MKKKGGVSGESCIISEDGYGPNREILEVRKCWDEKSVICTIANLITFSKMKPFKGKEFNCLK